MTLEKYMAVNDCHNVSVTVVKDEGISRTVDLGVCYHPGFLLTILQDARRTSKLISGARMWISARKMEAGWGWAWESSSWFLHWGN